ncbi:glycerophosphodiester phosphodiesterase [Streptomyces chumphonensis]|uniref:Glycerophosphodiester phosphodiesterase n=1 Tax=Streptomyces chumphonensis TaxID=1214925 RepID=A0A927IBP9_9ACTN|nr:glycerophosphodiester phosphodiesterase [Streptomyces chumphonensis]
MGWHDVSVRRPVSVIAHRGASEDAPEHTLAAYRMAIEHGADGLECDVRLTADGHLVCVHDRRVDRVSNGRGAVSTLELADLAALDFGSWKDPYEKPESMDRHGRSVLTLDRLLRLVKESEQAGRRVELAIETKHPTRWAGQVEERLVALVREYGLTDSVRVMSFSARSLHRVRRALPQVPTVFLMQFLLPRHREGRLPPGVGITGPSMRIIRNHPDYVIRAQRAGHRVHVWTVDDPLDVELCARLDVDGIITNRPRQVIDQLRSLGRR